ncbi:uncharacterized protein NPIL_532881 [Nephila pilipes]|uniref:Uncharacterized protein n=1 Tax=Nephila pilipes TaxID=299642 RepID=A0A8X6P050_NEPPI|nr:uncharacterized protein NPIL_532881 [Nephila pilipes]
MLLAVFSFMLLHGLTTGCPKKEDLFPCTCEWPSSEGNAYVTCAKLDNEHDLMQATSSLAGRSYVYSLVIEDSIFNFIPADAFKGLKFAELEIKDTVFRALTDTDVAFEGLENYLEFLIMTRCTLMNEWDWTIFRNLKKLTRLEIVEADLGSIEDLDKLNISSITRIVFDKNRISYIYPHAFASFKDLTVLSLAENAIEEVKRTMLPNPALELLDFDIRNNLIEQLPSDIFTNMPKLESLSISNNKILVLEENTFSSVWENLEFFTAAGNELRCDCRMAWIVEKKKGPKKIRAFCSSPPEVKGHNIDTLTSKDVWCFK